MNIEKPTNIAELEASIAYYEWQQAAAKAGISKLGVKTQQAIHPVHLLHEVIDATIEQPNLKEELLQTISKSSGEMARKIIVRKSENEWIHLLGDTVKKGVTTWLNKELHQNK